MKLWKRIRWTVQPLVMGRLYFEDGTTRRAPRGHIWSCLRAMPVLRLRRWVIGKTPRWTERPGCGCLIWRGKREAVCGDHLFEELRLMEHRRLSEQGEESA